MGQPCSKRGPSNNTQKDVKNSFDEQEWMKFIQRRGVVSEVMFYLEAKKFSETTFSSLKELRKHASMLYCKYFDENCENEIGLESVTRRILDANMKNLKRAGNQVFLPAMREVLQCIEPQFLEFSRITGVPVSTIKACSGFISSA